MPPITLPPIVTRNGPWLLALGLLASPFSAMAGDPEAGQEKARTCGACHGANGIAPIDRYPSLAGQNEGYLVLSMLAYKNGNRRGGQATVMHGQMSNFNTQDIKDMAAYYAAMPRTGAE
ncbi:MAG: cytochrome c [Halomonadaceae bacterium]|nr:MAG: cytochrome c [Halomonadaceae bacterium]